MQDVESDASAQQSGAQNGNVGVRVGQGGNTGQVTQGNNANSAASSSATGNIPQSTTTPSATDPTSGNTAAGNSGTGNANLNNPNAIATGSTKQDSPSNANVQVRVGSPGDIAPVGQGNSANANAGATGTTGSNGAGGGGQADANATQTNPTNLNVTVRVDSPGNNGAVTQKNTVGATAGPSTGTAGTIGAPTTAGPAQTDQASIAQNTFTDVTNNGVVTQQLVQTQDGDGPDVNTVGDDAVDPAAVKTTGTATATQTGAQNVNVSIRVGSPGKDETVTQTNGATATGTSPDLSIVNVTGSKNTNVSVVLPGSANGAPGKDWNWNWTWTGDGTPVTGASATTAAPTDGSTWNWAWTNTPTSAPTSSAPSTSTPTGKFTWIWTWTTPDGHVWSFTQEQSCDCNWTWTWNWDWTSGAPKSTASSSDASADATPVDAPTATYDDGPVDQANTVEATATASADVTWTGVLAVDQQGADPALGMQDAEFGQSFQNSQTAVAVADAQQTRPWNYNTVWGVPFASVDQTNYAGADSRATVTATLDQELIQGQDGTDESYQWAGAQQTTSNLQAIGVGTESIQSDAVNLNFVSAPKANHASMAPVEQTNSATANAAASADVTITQQLAQFEDASFPGVQLISLTQVVNSIQTALIGSIVIQTKVRNIDDVVVPAGSRATNPSLRQRNIARTTTTAEDIGNLSSVAFQYQGGAVEIEITDGLQQIGLIQVAQGYSPAANNNSTNWAGWLGVEPPLPGGGDDGSGQGSSTSGPAAGPRPAANGLVRIYGPFASPKKKAPQTAARTAPHFAPRLSFAHPTFHLPLPGGLGPAAFAPPAVAAPHGSAPAAGNVSTSTSWTQVEQSSFPTTPTVEAAAPYGAPHATGGTAPGQPTFPSLPPGSPDNPLAGGTGSSASAPSTGSGQTAIVFAPYKFAAQLVTGPQVPTSVLGRPAAFLEPFEWPG